MPNATLFPAPPVRTSLGSATAQQGPTAPVTTTWPWIKWFNSVGQKLSTPVDWPAPATSADPGQAGQVAIDANYLYVCVGGNPTVWKRVSLSSF